ncbi:MAG: hypothetical protein R3B69_04545 [Candidatus Paceibacterota bacterium]
MSEVLHANIFFVIASVATVCFAIMVCVLLFHIIKIVRAVRRIVERVEQGSEALASDVEELRKNLNPARLFGFVMNIIPTPPKSKKDDNEDE